MGYLPDKTYFLRVRQITQISKNDVRIGTPLYLKLHWYSSEMTMKQAHNTIFLELKLPCIIKCCLVVSGLPGFLVEFLLRGNVEENQRGAQTCRRNLCSYSSYTLIMVDSNMKLCMGLKMFYLFGFLRHYLLN